MNKDNDKRKLLIEKLIECISFLAIFSTLSILVFILAGCNFDNNLISLYIFSCIFFLLGVFGIIFQNVFFKLFYKLGYKVLSSSHEFSDMVVSKKSAFKTYNTTMIVLNIISFILLLILILIIIL